MVPQSRTVFTRNDNVGYGHCSSNLRPIFSEKGLTSAKRCDTIWLIGVNAAKLPELVPDE
jgi:hypothetical protein